MSLIQPWITPPKKVNKTTKAKKTRQAKNKPILHPVFEQCAEICPIGFWSEVLEKAARGKPPSGFFIQPGVLGFRKRNKSDFVNIPEQVTSRDITPVLNNILDFFRDNGVKSPEEQKIEDQVFDQYIWLNENLPPFEPEWNKFSVQATKNLLYGYARDFSRAYGLTNKEMKSFHGKLITAKMMGLLNNEMVEMGGSENPGADDSPSEPHGVRIKHVHCVIWDEETRTSMIDPELIDDRIPAHYTIPKTTRKEHTETHKYVNKIMRSFARDMGIKLGKGSSGESPGLTGGETDLYTSPQTPTET